jgi:hypothetical protein
MECCNNAFMQINRASAERKQTQIHFEKLLAKPATFTDKSKESTIDGVLQPMTNERQMETWISVENSVPLGELFQALLALSMRPPC